MDNVLETLPIDSTLPEFSTLVDSIHNQTIFLAFCIFVLVGAVFAFAILWRSGHVGK